MHWTYKGYSKEEDLCQGDIIAPSSALTKLFKEVHPHFTHNKYLGFLVLTQSCDLVRRQTLCKTTHVSLSVIRSLQDIISGSLKDRFGYLAPGVFAADMKPMVKPLFERVLNQNENALGLFYLHRDLDAGISEPCVALLRISISVRAGEHYDSLVDARCGRLSELFQPKLGWMVGNLYSRVGVPDWKEKSTDPDIEEKLLNQILSSTTSSSIRQEPLWIKTKVFNKIKKDYPDFEKLPLAEQEKLVQQYLPPPPKEIAIDQIATIIKKVYPTISDDVLKKIKSHLTNDESLNGHLKKWAKS
ncbi:hypothetical protein C4553_01065 [Candidatus Parcubacteria bacterium]|nr:MAG: hypothetical protein C4553_01065 [Candidatus Parcubacteria bacterium]